MVCRRTGGKWKHLGMVVPKGIPFNVWKENNNQQEGMTAQTGK